MARISEAIFFVDRGAPTGLQSQIRETLVSGILSGRLIPGARLPSSRRLASYLGIARITVTQTAAQGFAEGQAQFRPALPQQPPAPLPEVVASAEAVAARFDDPKLADSMRRLALARAARDTRKRPLFSQD